MSPRRPHALRAALAALLTAAALLPLSADRAEAFCGFYVSGADGKLFNDATMVVMMREGQRTVLSMQNNYKGPPEDFAMVVPVPVILEEEHVKTLPQGVFDRVDRMASPRLVEYWEQDPCAQPPPEPVMGRSAVLLSVEEDSGGWFEDEEETVVIEAQFEVGEYEVLILSAGESAGLERWLKKRDYNIPDGAAAALDPYIQQGLYFFVARVKVDEVTFEDGRAVLSPLRFHYDAEGFSLPIRLGMLNAAGPQDLIVHILARGQRYQVVNRKNVTIPTNIDLKPAAKDQFGAFYASLFDRVQQKNPGAVVTEYAWDASSCDPCPGPTLTAEDFMTLGADVLPQRPQWGYTLTRLHTRYTAETMKDDLIFAAAPPITGGREVYIDTNEIEQGAKPAARNNFQGRYAIRHRWEGDVDCEDPQYGRWGGPPNDPYGESVKPAEDIGFAPRGEVDLASVVETPIPEVELGVAELEAVDDTEPRTPPAVPPSAVGPKGGGCATCAVAAMEDGGGKAFGAAWLLLVGLAVWVRRRR